MNGATPEVLAKTNNRPKSIRTVIIGIIHHNFRCHKNTITSPRIPVLVIIPWKKFFTLVPLYFSPAF